MHAVTGSKYKLHVGGSWKRHQVNLLYLHENDRHKGTHASKDCHLNQLSDQQPQQMSDKRGKGSTTQVRATQAAIAKQHTYSSLRENEEMDK